MHHGRLIRMVAHTNGAVATVFFAALSVVVALQVFTRFVLHDPLLWSEEVARFLFFWTVLLGAALSVYHRRHFVIDLRPQSDTSAPLGWPARIWRSVPQLTIIGFCIFLLVTGIGYTEAGQFRTGTNSRVNMAYVYAAIPTFAALSTLYAAGHVVDDLSAGRRGVRPRTPPAAD